MRPSTVGKIPENAKRVFKGVIFDVYQWQQQMFDGSTATFEAVKRPGTIQVIPVVGDKIFLSYEEQPTKSPTYTFLGGRQEEGEDPMEGAKRELLEESGLQSDDWELYKTYSRPGKVDHNTYLVIARNCRKVAEQNLDAGERIEVKEHSFEEFVDKVTEQGFWGDSELILDFFRMKSDSAKLAEFRTKLLG